MMFVCPKGCKPTTFVEKQVVGGSQRRFNERGEEIRETKLCCAKCGSEAKTIKPIYG